MDGENNGKPYSIISFDDLVVTLFLVITHIFPCRVPKVGVFRGGGNWGTLRIPTKDWGTLGKIREPPPLGTPPLNNPIIQYTLVI